MTMQSYLLACIPNDGFFFFPFKSKNLNLPVNISYYSDPENTGVISVKPIELPCTYTQRKSNSERRWGEGKELRSLPNDHGVLVINFMWYLGVLCYK